MTAPSTWWNTNYLFRRSLNVSVLEAIPAGHPAIYTFDASLFYSMGKLRTDNKDLAIVYYDGSKWIALSNQIGMANNNLSIKFLLQAAIQANGNSQSYFMYYGNRNLVDIPDLSAFPQNIWPFTIGYQSNRITYTHPGEDWKNGITDIRGARATFQFTGPQVRLQATGGLDKGRMGIQLDNGPIKLAELYRNSPDMQIVAFELDNLVSEFHTLRMMNIGEHNPSSTGTSINIVEIDYVGYVLVADLGEDITELDWAVHMGGA